MTDTGIGLSDEQQKLIFEPFRQADGSVTRRYGGTGLGLAICSNLAQLMGGGYRREQHAGEGSTFSFTLDCPISGGARRLGIRERGKCVSGANAGTFRVLLAEDNRVNQLLMVRLLEARGHK